MSSLLIHYSEFAVREDFINPFMWKLTDVTSRRVLLNFHHICQRSKQANVILRVCPRADVRWTLLALEE